MGAVVGFTQLPDCVEVERILAEIPPARPTGHADSF
jgi:hypothetical protein